MTCLNWGCDPLEKECESCLDALCRACNEESGRKPGNPEMSGGAGEEDRDTYEPDCDTCDREKKPVCSRCEIILDVCHRCSENKTCEFKITGLK